MNEFPENLLSKKKLIKHFKNGTETFFPSEIKKKRKFINYQTAPAMDLFN